MQYVISDIHGEYYLLCKLLDKIRFSGGDRLFVLGDMIDKGDGSVAVLKLLFSMPGVTCITGNHEHAFLKYFDSLAGGIDEKLAQAAAYFTDGRFLDEGVIDGLNALEYFVYGDGFLGVHAGVPLDAYGRALPPESAMPEQLVFDRRFKDVTDFESELCVIYGHTPVRYISGRDEFIFYPKNAHVPSDRRRISDFKKIHIDTGVYLSGRLGCLCVDNCEAIYI